MKNSTLWFWLSVALNFGVAVCAVFFGFPPSTMFFYWGGFVVGAIYIAGKYIHRNSDRKILFVIGHAGGETYGLRIAELYEKIFDDRLSTGAMYIALERLREQGYLTTRDEQGGAERGNLPKRFFALTEKANEKL